MATLQFKGKNIIWNHHMSVPYHTLDLDEKLSYKQDRADGNLIVEGDNLPALKSLLPQYTGKIKCIYIDPPYNTGKEGWVYNDNVNSPLLKEWIGKEVGSDDLTRHDKWLSMITPRLKLLKELLADDGIIFISINDNENHHLRCLLDEIFGIENFIGQLVWSNKEGGGSSDSKHIRVKHEYILCYSRDVEKLELLGLPISNPERYTKSDKYSKTRGNYYLQKLGMGTIQYSKSLDYEIKTPDGTLVTPKDNNRGKKACWRWSKDKLEWGLENDYVVFDKDKDGTWIVYTKQYMNADNEGNLIERTQRPFGLIEKFSSTQASKELQALSINSYFDYSKPFQLIQYLLQISTSKQDIILDAFAGSGTTAQAVLELNEEDEGNRRFILIQMPENSEKEPKKNIARDITRERVVKVIEKKLKNKDIGFEYRRVGQPIDAETILSGQLPTYKQLAKYVYYLATGQSPKDKDIDEKKFLAGKVDHTEVYLLYTPDMDELKKMAITFEWAKGISKGNDNKKIVYAPACFMDDEYLEQFNIKFVSIPYNLFEREQ